MRDMKPVSADEFNAFIAAYTPTLEQRKMGTVMCYIDPTDGVEWPDNLVASYLVATNSKPRASGWRVAVENSDA